MYNFLRDLFEERIIHRIYLVITYKRKIFLMDDIKNE